MSQRDSLNTHASCQSFIRPATLDSAIWRALEPFGGDDATQGLSVRAAFFLSRINTGALCSSTSTQTCAQNLYAFRTANDTFSGACPNVC